MVLSGKWIIVENLRLSEVSQTLTLTYCMYSYVEYRLLFFIGDIMLEGRILKKGGKLEGEKGKKRFKSVKYDQMTYGDIEI